MSNENVADGDVRRKGGLGQRIAYACGNLGQAAFYNAMSTYFVTYVTSCLFVSYSKALAAQMIAVITGLIVVIRIAEIFIDPLLGNLVDNTTTKWGRFRPWQFIGGLVSSVLIMLIFSGMFGLVNVNTTLFIVLFVITFIVLDVFYSLRDISYWGMIPALSSDSHERSTYTAPWHLHRLYRLQRHHRHRHPDRQLLHLDVHRRQGPGPGRMDLLRLHRRAPRPDYRLDRRLWHQGKHQRAACQGPEERQPVRGVQGAVPERPAAVGRPVLPAVRHRKRHHDRCDVLPLRVRA